MRHMNDLNHFVGLSAITFPEMRAGLAASFWHARASLQRGSSVRDSGRDAMILGYDTGRFV